MTGGQYQLPSWRRCNERLIGSCKDTASGCCGAMACNLCLVKNEGTEDEELGSAVESAGEYTGDFGFFGYWRRAYGDDSCEFVVEIDGEEVGSFPKCGDYGDGMDCRKLEGVVEYGYDTLRFKYSRPLQLKHHREGKCKSNFCGSCSCTNRFICFTMTGPDCEFSAVIEYDEAYDLCEDETESPRWYVEAECGYFLYEGWISLERDQYTGDCLLRVPGLDEPIEITDCKPLTAEWEIENEDDPYSPYQMSIVGTDCGDCAPPPPPLVSIEPCCEQSNYLVPSVVTMEFEGCHTGQVVLTYGPNPDGVSSDGWFGEGTLRNGGVDRPIKCELYMIGCTWGFLAFFQPKFPVSEGTGLLGPWTASCDPFELTFFSSWSPNSQNTVCPPSNNEAIVTVTA